MKKLNFTVVLMMLILFAGVAQAGVWTNKYMSFEGGSLRVVAQSAMASDWDRTQWLIEMADRSTVTINPLNQDIDGLINPGDIIAISENMLLWFDTTNDGSATLNGGGGMLRGIWQLTRDTTGNQNFTRIVNGYNWAPNLLFPGSKPGYQGSGFSLLGNYNVNIDNGKSFGIEHESNVEVTAFTGTDTPEGDVFVQFKGYIGNSPNMTGIDSKYDVDARAGYEGRALYVLSYRIPCNGTKFRTEISVFVESGQFGPVSTYVASHNVAGYDGSDMVWGSDAYLTGGQGSYVRDYTSYYTEPGKSMKFYKQPWNPTFTGVKWGDNASGTTVSIGCPAAVAPHFKATLIRTPDGYTSKKLQTIDNRGIGAFRVNALDFACNDLKTFTTGTNLYTIIDYELR